MAIPRVRGSQKHNLFKGIFYRGVGGFKLKEVLLGRGMDIFWNTTLYKYMYLVMKSVNNHLLLILILGGSKSG